MAVRLAIAIWMLISAVRFPPILDLMRAMAVSPCERRPLQYAIAFGQPPLCLTKTGGASLETTSVFIAPVRDAVGGEWAVSGSHHKLCGKRLKHPLPSPCTNATDDGIDLGASLRCAHSDALRETWLPGYAREDRT